MRKIVNVMAFKEAPTTLQAPPRQQDKRKPKSKAKLPTPSSSVENIKIEMNNFLTTHLPQFPVEKMIKETNITAAQRRAIAATKGTSQGNQAGGVEMMEADATPTSKTTLPQKLRGSHRAIPCPSQCLSRCQNQQSPQMI